MKVGVKCHGEKSVSKGKIGVLGVGVELAILNGATRLASDQRSEGDRYVSLSGKSFHTERTFCAKTPKQVCARCV